MSTDRYEEDFPPAAGKSNRGRRALIVIVLLAVVLLVAAIAADIGVRAYATERIGSELRTALDLEPDAPIDVEIGGFSMLAQLVQGSLDRVDVSSDEVALGELTGSARVTALGVPIDTTRPVGNLTIDFSINEDDLGPLSANLSGLPISAVTIRGEEIHADLDFEVFGVPIPLGVGVLTSAEDGQLAFTPSSVALNRVELSAEALRDQFGFIADTALATRSFCIAQYLPAAFVLKDVAVADRDLVLSFVATDAVLSADALAVSGTCPA